MTAVLLFVVALVVAFVIRARVRGSRQTADLEAAPLVVRSGRQAGFAPSAKSRKRR